MEKRKFTQEQVEFLKENVEGNSFQKLTDMLNENFGTQFTRDQITNAAQWRGFRNGLDGAVQRKYTQEQIDFLRENTEGRTRSELIALFYERFGIQLSPQKLVNIKNYYGFLGKKGNRYNQEQVDFVKTNAANGRKRKELINMFYERYGISLTRSALDHIRCKRRTINPNPCGGETKLFTPKAIGATRICHDGFVKVKQADSTWKYKHIIIWEEANGPIQDGYRLMFIDGNRQNCDLDNLALVTLRQLGAMSRKNLRATNPKLIKSAIAVAEIYLKIGDIQKRQKKVGKQCNA